MIDFVFECHLGEPENNSYIQYQLGTFGRDWILLIGGGKIHIGAIAYSNLKQQKKNTYQLEGHKEGILVEEALNVLGPMVNNEIVVIAGVHYDQIQPRQIKTIVFHSRILLGQVKSYLSTVI